MKINRERRHRVMHVCQEKSDCTITLTNGKHAGGEPGRGPAGCIGWVGVGRRLGEGPELGVGSRVGQQGGFIAHRALLCLLCCLRAGIIQRRGGKYSKETEYTESQSSSSIHMHAC